MRNFDHCFVNLLINTWFDLIKQVSFVDKKES